MQLYSRGEYKFRRKRRGSVYYPNIKKKRARCHLPDRELILFTLWNRKGSDFTNDAHNASGWRKLTKWRLASLMYWRHGYRINWIRPRLSFMTPLVIFFYVDSFQKVLIKPTRHLLRLHQHLHASCTHAAHTKLAFILTLAQGGNICKTLFGTCFLAVECRGGCITASQLLVRGILWFSYGEPSPSRSKLLGVKELILGDTCSGVACNRKIIPHI